MANSNNQGKRIVYKGSEHLAVATAPDVCKVPPAMTETPFPNWIGTNIPVNFAASVETGNMPVMHEGSALGPLSNPEHIGTAGGVTSGTYRDEAKATSGSPDMFVEGSPVIRTGDPTSQNKANTVGVILGTGASSEDLSMLGVKEQKCYLKRLTATRSKDGATLGWRTDKHSSEADYLEIREDHTVEFIAHRFDVETDAMYPACAAGEAHTLFKIEINTFPFMRTIPNAINADSFVQAGADAIDLPVGCITQKVIDAAGPQLQKYMADISEAELDAKEKEIFKKNFDFRYKDTRDKRNNIAEGREAGIPGTGWEGGAAEANDKIGWAMQADKDADESRAARHEYAREMAKTELIKEKAKKAHLDDATKAVQALFTIFRLFAWWYAPPSILVTAKTCSGEKSATIKVFPKECFTWEIAKTKDRKPDAKGGWIAKVLDGFAKFQKTASKVQNLVEKARVGVKFEVHILDTFKISLTAEYKPCTMTKLVYGTDGNLIKYISPAHMGLDWTFKMDLNPLVSLNFSYEYNFLKLAGLIFPGIGSVAAKLLDMCRVGFYLVLGCEISSNVNLTLGLDQDWEIKYPNAAFAIHIKPYIELVIRVSHWWEPAQAEFAFNAEGKAEFELKVDKTPRVLVYMSYTYKTTAKLTLQAPGLLSFLKTTIPKEVADQEIAALSGGTPPGGDPYDLTKPRILVHEIPLDGT